MGILKKPITQLLLIAVFGLVAYSNTFDAPFQFDDDINIVENPLVKDLGYYASSSKPAEVSQYVYSQFRSRIVGYLTFALNYKINGLDVTGYHVFNLLVHLINAFLVYALVIAAFRTPFLQEYEGRGIAPQAAFFSGLLFVSHPIETQAVTYIVQRFESLAALFYLSALLAYVRSRLSTRTPARLAFYALALASVLLSIKTKEIAVTMPIAIVVFELFFFRGPLKKRFLYLVPIVLILAAAASSYMDFGRNLDEKTTVATSISRLDYLLTHFTAMVMYMRLLLFPINQNLDYDYPIYSSFFSSHMLAAFLILFSIAALGVMLLFRSRHKAGEMRFVAFGIFFFFITMLPGLFPTTDMIFEHRVYLPSVGAFIAIVTFSYTIASTYSNRIPLHGKALTILLVLVSTILCAATYKRNIVWADSVRLWEDTVSKSPMKARPHYNLGTAYADRGQAEKSIKHFLLAIKFDPSYVKAYNNLGNAYVSQGLISRAIEAFTGAVSVDPDFVDGLYNLGNAYLKINQAEKAIEYFRRALNIKPDAVDARINLGNAYFSKGMTEKAVEQYKIAAALKPDFASIQINIGNAYFSQGSIDEAIESYKRALNLDVNLPQVHYYLGLAYKKKNMPAKAEEHFRISGKRPGN